MKKKISDLIIIIIFIVEITVPQISFWFLKEHIPVSNNENRELNKKPELKISTITQYPKEFDNYYNDHLPFRNNLRKIWTDINYELFKTTVDDRVILGKEGWLFYRGDKTIEQLQGIESFTQKDKENLLEKMQLNSNKLKEKSIELYYLILPNKENVYREYLPDIIPIKNSKSRTEELIEYIKNNSDINIVYPKQELLEAKERYQVYRKYDTHWNKIGACVGAIALQKEIDSKFNYNIADLQIEVDEKIDTHDLANFASLEHKKYEKQLKVTNFYSEIQCKNIGNEQYISNSENDKTVLFIGDSFRTDMQEYFSKLYKKVIYVHREEYKKELINEIKPSIVIFETIERNSNTLIKEII